MRTKLTTATCLIAAVAIVGAGSAFGGPVTIAKYSFNGKRDVASFTKFGPGKCTKKKASKAMAIRSEGAVRCAYRTSVLADSSTAKHNVELGAAVGPGKGSKKKVFMSVSVRASNEAGYELRLVSSKRKWQLWRDPVGAGGPALLKAGKAKGRPKSGAKMMGKGKRRTTISLRASGNRLLVKINGRKAATASDSAADAPNGRHTVVAIGSKGGGPLTGTGLFDDVAVRVPNPF